MEKFDSNILKRHSPYQEERFDWGYCLKTVIGISAENRTSIYRKEEESDIWRLLTWASSYDELLEQLSDAYQMLCSPQGRKLTERCYRTEDLRLLF